MHSYTFTGDFTQCSLLSNKINFVEYPLTLTSNQFILYSLLSKTNEVMWCSLLTKTNEFMSCSLFIKTSWIQTCSLLPTSNEFIHYSFYRYKNVIYLHDVIDLIVNACWYNFAHRLHCTFCNRGDKCSPQNGEWHVQLSIYWHPWSPSLSV